jgi:hypothetical protein
VGVTQTGADGTYVLALSPGTYRVTFFATSAGDPWAQQWWNSRSTQSEGDPVVVGSGVMRLDATLLRGGSVEGRITDAATGSAMAASVEAYDGSKPCCTTRLGGTGTRSDGTYSIVLPAGPAWVLFIAPGYATQYGQTGTDPARATPLTIDGNMRVDVKLTRK